MRGLLEQQRLLRKSGTIVDATIIDAPPSTKNEAKARDPEMKQGKKNGREWHFGMKVHVGTDRNGVVHTLVTTDAGASEFNDESLSAQTATLAAAENVSVPIAMRTPMGLANRTNSYSAPASLMIPAPSINPLRSRSLTCAELP